MSPEELAELDEDVELVIVNPETADGQPHLILEAGAIVTVVGGGPHYNDAGEVMVQTVMEEGAQHDAFQCFILPAYLLTHAEVHAAVHDHADEPEREFTYVPHEEYPNLPTYETLPLGYSLGLMRYIAAQQRL